MVQGVQHPERYGLHERAFARTIQLIQTQSLQNEESLAQQQTTESRQTPSGSISVAQRFEQQELMTDLSDLAEVDRITSPTIAPYHLSPSSQPGAAPARRPTSPMADMSLGGGRGRMNSNERDAWQRNQLAALLGSTSGAGRAAQNNSQVRLAIEQMMMEEAIRLSMADAGGGGGGGGGGEGGGGGGGSGGGGGGEGSRSRQSSFATSDESGGDQRTEEMDDDLAAAIAASLAEAEHAKQAQRTVEEALQEGASKTNVEESGGGSVLTSSDALLSLFDDDSEDSVVEEEVVEEEVVEEEVVVVEEVVEEEVVVEEGTEESVVEEESEQIVDQVEIGAQDVLLDTVVQ